jgi:riboflavin kinase/FMN adenylyltransferase
LFDFSQTVYGKTVKVVFRKKIREEKKFKGLDELKTAIAQDVMVARAYFEAKHPS